MAIQLHDSNTVKCRSHIFRQFMWNFYINRSPSTNVFNMHYLHPQFHGAVVSRTCHVLTARNMTACQTHIYFNLKNYTVLVCYIDIMQLGPKKLRLCISLFHFPTSNIRLWKKCRENLPFSTNAFSKMLNHLHWQQ